MGEQNVLAKADAVARDFRIDRHPRQIAQPLQSLQPVWIEAERNQRRSRRDDADAELPGDPIAERRRPDLRHRQAAGSDHQRARSQLAAVGAYREARRVARGPRHADDTARDKPLNPGLAALVAKHGDDLRRRAVAEQLPELFFMPRDAVAVDQRDEVRGRVPRERRATEFGIARQKIGRRAMDVGEVAAAATRDPDLLADDREMLDQRHPAAAPRGSRGAHHACGTGADDDNVEFHLQHPSLMSERCRFYENPVRPSSG